MTDIIKQRLIGALLLLIVIVAVASFLITNAHYENKEVIEQPEFTSSIEPLVADIIEPEREILLDPHQLGNQENNVEIADTLTDTLPTPTPTTSPKPTPTPATWPRPGVPVEERWQTMQMRVRLLRRAAARSPR